MAVRRAGETPATPRVRATAATLLCLLLAAGEAAAQSVQLSGSLGSNKALLLIDGAPHTVAVGSTVKGVTLRQVADGQAEVEVGGRTQWLRLGASPSSVGGGAARGGLGGSIVLAAGPGGHYLTSGQINGKPIQFLVDTGATHIAFSQAEATRLGLDWQRGQRAVTMTANGPAPVYQITLSSVRVGDVEVANVSAVVIPADLPVALLGNSFLNRFSMRRDADVLRLDKKP